jgi:hypothetical protein
MAGGSAAYAGVPFFWSGQFGEFVLFCGHNAGFTRTVLRGDLARRDFLIFYLNDADQVLGAASMGMEREKELAAVAELMRQGRLPAAEEVERADLVGLLEAGS